MHITSTNEIHDYYGCSSLAKTVSTDEVFKGGRRGFGNIIVWVIRKIFVLLGFHAVVVVVEYIFLSILCVNYRALQKLLCIFEWLVNQLSDILSYMLSH